jgi:hypothetical protein
MCVIFPRTNLSTFDIFCETHACGSVLYTQVSCYPFNWVLYNQSLLRLSRHKLTLCFLHVFHNQNVPELMMCFSGMCIEMYSYMVQN